MKLEWVVEGREQKKKHQRNRWLAELVWARLTAHFDTDTCYQQMN